MKLLGCRFRPFLFACAPSLHAAVPADCWAQRKHGHSAEATACFEQLTRSGDAYIRAEGFWGLEQWEQANEQFRLATQSRRQQTHLQGPLGNVVAPALQRRRCRRSIPRSAGQRSVQRQAYVGLATVSADGFDGKAAEYLRTAIALDPKIAEAHELMADVALANDDRDLAAAEADKAIAIESDALDAMAIHAALELIADRSPDAWFARIQAVNPHYGESLRACCSSSRVALSLRRMPLPIIGKPFEVDSAPLVRPFRAGHRPHAPGQRR